MYCRGWILCRPVRETTGTFLPGLGTGRSPEPWIKQREVKMKSGPWTLFCGKVLPAQQLQVNMGPFKGGYVLRSSSLVPHSIGPTDDRNQDHW